MSAGPIVKKPASMRVRQAIVLVALFGLLYATTRFMPVVQSRANTVVALGFLLLAGTLASELLEIIGLPHLSGYLLAGIVAGPNVLHLIDHHTVDELTSVNALALALIALEGGAELKIAILRQGFKSLAWATLMQSLPLAVLMTGVVLLARPLVPFLRELSPVAILGVGILWGTLAMTRSPSACLGILSQTRAQGPLARFTLSFIMTSDIVVVVFMAVALMVARPMVEPAATFSLRQLEHLGHDILGSVALGTTLGLVLAAYMRLVGKQLIVVYLALGFGMTEVLKYLRLEALLTFMVAGFVVQNFSKQGEKLLKSIAQAGSLVYVVFFASAGAHLDIPLLKDLWPVALLFFGTRALFSYLLSRGAAYIAKSEPVIHRWGWSGLISQAGIALGVANVIGAQFPSFGKGFRALAIATVALNEMIGPIFFKLALDRSGESSTTPPEALSSLSDEHKDGGGHGEHKDDVAAAAPS